MINRRDHGKGGNEAEQNLLKRCETTIACGLKNFLGVGEALSTIREKRLYRLKKYPTFDEYCRKEWRITRQHASRLVLTFRLNETLSPHGDKPVIESEGMARRFRQLPPNTQKEVAKAIAAGADARAEIKKATLTAEEFMEQIEPALDLNQLSIKELVDALVKMLAKVASPKRLDLVKPILECLGEETIKVIAE